MDNIRETAVLHLYQLLNGQAVSEDVFSEDTGTAFIKMLCLTACRNTVSLNHVINRYLHKKIPNKQAVLKTILIAATTELLFMETPDYAVINSYVGIAKKQTGKFSSGFINAVLRAISADKQKILDSYQPAFFPDSFLKILKKDYDSQTIKQIETASLTPPPLNLTIKENTPQWAENLNGTLVNQTTVSLPSAGKIEEISGYTEGKWWVQDTAAALAVPQFSDLKGKRVLDLCAAPGGKTAQLATAGALVTALDCSEPRLQILRKNLSRLNLQIKNIICADALDYLQNFKETPFDAILLDAPCSATGIFRRHPELVYLKTLNDVSRQVALQKKLLEAVSPALKQGGELIYCTCSIAKEEGEKQILDFLANHHNFRLAPLSNSEAPETVTSEGFIRTLPFHYPQSGGCDAFFIAKLVKEQE